MSRHISSLSFLVALIASAEGLQQHPYQSGDDSDAWNSVPVGAHHMATSAGEYHRAAGVPRGECTKRLRPNLLFIGQAHSGSTSLSDQLQRHPELSNGDTKEHQYFKPDYHKIKSESLYERYLDEFWVSCNVTVAYDASQGYLILAEGTKTADGLDAVKYVRQRLGGNIKIMVMLRDPLDLMFHKQCAMGSKERPFSAEKPANCTKDTVRASLMLETWLKVFPSKSQWLFLSSDEYFQAPQKVLHKVFKFVGVKPMTFDSAELQAQSGRRRCNMKPSSAERNAYWGVSENKDDKHKLEKMTGLKFYWNS